MGDLADVYEATRQEICTLVGGLGEDDTLRQVPATPGWKIRDVLSHLTGDAACIVVGDFPAAFFAAMGEEPAIEQLNRWTAGHISARAGKSVAEIIDEWEQTSKIVVDMMREHVKWPEGVPPLAAPTMITDVGVHQHDIYGALGIERDRDGAPVRIGSAGYVAVLDLRLREAGHLPLAINAGEKSWTAGGDEPAATLNIDRFELFRALSGRRNADQIRAYDWTGDPEPYIPYFYLYGPRADALVE